jgi:hypothetical protein
MGLTQKTKLELLSYGQQGWNYTINRNGKTLDSIFEKFPLLWNQQAQSAGVPMVWDEPTGTWKVGESVVLAPVELVNLDTINTDCSLSQTFHITLGRNVIFSNPSNIENGKTYTWKIKQDDVGGRTATFGSLFRFPSGLATLSTEPGTVDFVNGIAINGTIYCTLVKGYTVTSNAYTAKTVAFKFLDNWGHTSYMGIRSIDFYKSGAKISLSASDFVAYATTVHDSQYVAKNAFDTSLLKTGNQNNMEWVSSVGSLSNQILVIVPNTPITFDRVVINNSHHVGTTTEAGVKNTEIYISDDSVSSAEIPTNNTRVFVGTFNQHITADQEDSQIIDLQPSGYTAKSLILDIADNWNGGGGWMGIRQIDLYSGGEKLTLTDADVLCYATTEYDSQLLAKYAFLSSTSKVGDDRPNAWAASSSISQRLICVFASDITFDEVVVNNRHDGGADTGTGAKNVKMYISTDTITDTTYNAAIVNSTKIFDGQFKQHIAQNIEDPETLELI